MKKSCTGRQGGKILEKGTYEFKMNTINRFRSSVMSPGNGRQMGWCWRRIETKIHGILTNFILNCSHLIHT